MNRYARTWKADDVVSAARGKVIGKVVILKRQSDGQPYVKVQITAGGAVGTWHWPDGWMLGTGSHEYGCLQCGQPYRSDETREDFCPACRRMDYDGADSRRAARVALRGNATPTASRPVTVPAEKPADDGRDPVLTEDRMTTSNVCEECGRETSNLVIVQTRPATFWSPAEYMEICDGCHEKAVRQAERDDEARSLRHYSDEQRERV